MKKITYYFYLIVFLINASNTGVQRSEAQEKNTSVLIVHHQVESEQTQSQKELSRIFSGRQRTWDGHQMIQIVLLPEGTKEMEWLCSEVLKIPENLLRRFIYQRVYRGTMKAPIEAKNSKEALEIVQRIAGAVAPIIVSEAFILSVTTDDEFMNIIKVMEE